MTRHMIDLTIVEANGGGVLRRRVDCEVRLLVNMIAPIRLPRRCASQKWRTRAKRAKDSDMARSLELEVDASPRRLNGQIRRTAERIRPACRIRDAAKSVDVGWKAREQIFELEGPML